MRKILGTREQYYVQTNNAQVELFKDYFNKKKLIACGPTSAAMGFDIAGRDMSIFTPGEQPEDSILMIAHNPVHLNRIKARRNLDYDIWPPNEVPEVYETIGFLLYNESVCRLMWGLNFDVIKININNDTPMMIHGKFPAGNHYVLIVGFDDEKNVIIYNDPYPVQWKNKNGYNREMSQKFFEKRINKWRVDFLPKK